MLERMLEGALIVIAIRAGVERCGFGEPSPPPRRRPVVAAMFALLLATGFVIGLAVPGAVDALAHARRCRRLVAAVHGAVRPGLGDRRRGIQPRDGDDRDRPAGVDLGEGACGRCLAGRCVGPLRRTGPGRRLPRVGSGCRGVPRRQFGGDVLRCGDAQRGAGGPRHGPPSAARPRRSGDRGRALGHGQRRPRRRVRRGVRRRARGVDGFRRSRSAPASGRGRPRRAGW